ncbi:hypothetical protein C8J56DRAFT_886171 [Mycena floridula]|nr:hypothetical protein C8J56DRAFT_886171 [Mycena floridula]
MSEIGAEARRVAVEIRKINSRAVHRARPYTVIRARRTVPVSHPVGVFFDFLDDPRASTSSSTTPPSNSLPGPGPGSPDVSTTPAHSLNLVQLWNRQDRNLAAANARPSGSGTGAAAATSTGVPAASAVAAALTFIRKTGIRKLSANYPNLAEGR